jgi:hypothetical protein
MTALRAARGATLILLAGSAVAAITIAITGGGIWHWGSLRLSARDPRNASILAGLAGAVAWALSSPAERRAAVRVLLACVLGKRGPGSWILAAPRRAAPVIVVLAGGAVVLFGLSKGAFTAGGADAYGHVSQAELWASGRLIVEQPVGREMRWPNVAATLSPLGYRPHYDPARATDLVPIYSPGAPLVMAAFQLVGGRSAVYLVVPLLGGLAVWATYAMGRRLSGRELVGASAATLLAASPSFLFEVTSPTSDVAATAWWASALALALIPRPSAALGAGVATSLAVLTRPNVAPLAVLVTVFLLRSTFPDRQRSPRRLLLFAAGAAPGPLLVALVNNHLFGSPLTSGYGSLAELYKPEYLAINLAGYPRWLFVSHTPFMLLALGAPLLLPRERASTGWAPRSTAALWLCFAGVVFACYAFYEPIRHWGYLRFLLPAFPALLVLSTTTLTVMAAPAARLARALPMCASLLVVAAVAGYCLRYAADTGMWSAWQREQRFVEAGRYIAAKLPERAALLSMEHSGSARYYSGRLTLRYDLIPPSALDLVIHELRRLGYQPYLLLDDWEETSFRNRFSGHSELARLDWWPAALLYRRSVRIYEVPDAAHGPGGGVPGCR